MTTMCLWCDDPTGGDTLCPTCRAVNDHPPFHCAVPGHTVPTLGPSCAECEQAAAAKRRQAEVTPMIEDLNAILARHLAGWRERWPGAEFAKSLVGNMILGAIRDLGGDERAALARALAEQYLADFGDDLGASMPGGEW